MKATNPFDKQIQTAIDQVAGRGPYFIKSEVVKVVRGQRALARIPPQIQAQINQRYLESRIGSLLGTRDHYGIRVYECYPAGSGQWRWMRLRSMRLAELQSVMEQTRTQERDLHIKSEGYEHFINELKKHGPRARVEDVYEAVAPRIQAHRGRAA